MPCVTATAWSWSFDIHDHCDIVACGSQLNEVICRSYKATLARHWVMIFFVSDLMCFVHWFNCSLIDLWFGVSLDTLEEMRKYALTP